MPENHVPLCSVIGMIDDGWPSLPAAAQTRLRAAARVIGARRTLDLVAPFLPEGTECLDMDGALSRTPDWIASALDAGTPVAVLATGDPLCHGIARFLIGKLGADVIEVMPAPSTIQLAFARLKKPWQDVRISSCHGPDAGEWRADESTPAPTPAHGLYKLVRAVASHPLVATFTSPHNSPDRIARALLAAGYGDDAHESIRLSVVARLCHADETVCADLSLADAASRRFPDPNIVIIERIARADVRHAPTRYPPDLVSSIPHTAPVFGFDDLDYVQRTPEKGLITKLEARAVSLARLGLRADSIVWDIGAGSGSVGLEASRIAHLGHVWAIEKNSGDAANARANARRMRASNYSLFEGKAPAGLDAWPAPDAVFIGGSGGELGELITRVLARLKPGGRLVMNFVTLENLALATQTLQQLGATWDVTMLSAARSQPILNMHRLAAQNPVWIVCAQAAGRPSAPTGAETDE
ncbi:MAG: cobalamin biosynthesis bifunctional protein CbiET [Betaproteobacteria bacterium HGW-Betaproteobacteria-13]|jgi:precorrin-6Y C5,15-methyltransferase (decarboxylating)|nr:MAG: cobalamin biosynthesis bifunctional protein CbiET [Betaproteobacteria bacterium HGW-Betaproteobacteria-13]